ncbi:MAG: hypothetical protein IJP53_00170 [Synergistaceae bacterium]|nr:hypothetical protein [Synergistaceae bacterium]
MKVNDKFGSIWDELPRKTEKKIPETQAEAMDLYQAAEASITSSTMKIWDSHNDMMAKSAELRKISARKKAIERQTLQRREESRELMQQAAEEAAKRSKELEAASLKHSDHA